MKSLITLFIFFTATALTQDHSKGFFETVLPDLNNKAVSFQSLTPYKATAVIFLLSDCPASQSYTLTLNKLYQKFKSRNVAFVGVFPGNYSTDQELKDFQTQYKIGFPLLKDPAMKLSSKLHASIAPGCFLIDEKGNISYEGRIDDWLNAIGKSRQVVTQNNLSDAITSVLNNTPVKIKKTDAIGCILEYENN